MNPEVFAYRELVKNQATCEHESVEPHVSRFTGTYSLECQDCGVYIIDFDESEGDE